MPGPIKTPLPQVQKLILHNTSRLKMSTLTIAIKMGRIPRLAYLEAIWRECRLEIYIFDAAARSN